MKQIHWINPASLMFGSDLPSTRAKTPFNEDDIDLIKDSFDEADLGSIFYQNAQRWYAGD